MGCINEEGKPNAGGRSTSNGTSIANQEEGRNHDDVMKWRGNHWSGWGETWETRRSEGNAHKKGLGFGWIIMRCSFSKEDPMQQLSNTTSPCPTCALWETIPLPDYQRYSTIIYLISIIHWCFPYIWLEFGHLKNGRKKLLQPMTHKLQNNFNQAQFSSLMYPVYP